MRKGMTRRSIAAASTLVLLCNYLAACSPLKANVAELEAHATRQIEAEREKAEQAVPVVTSTSGAWLMGESVEVTPPQSPVLTRTVTYHPAQRVSLIDVATWISGITGIKVDTVEVQERPIGNQAQPSSLLPPPPMLQPQLQSPAVDAGHQLQHFAISYEGTLAGLLDVAANKAGVWWKFDQGRLSFYRTETRTFYIPAVKLISTGDSSIAATPAASGAGGQGGGQGGAAGAGAGAPVGGGQGGGSAGGANSNSSYVVDVWGDLEKTAKVVAAGAQVVPNKSMGSITVTGTPGQVRNVEEWVKGLTDNMSQQVAITVQIYKVRTTAEDNYNWTPNVIFKSLKAKYGFNFTGLEPPAVASGNAPMGLTTAILGAYGTGRAAQFSGSELAFQALSKLGTVSETLRKTVVTLNGQPAPMQVANQLSYLASVTAAPSVQGVAPLPPSLTPGMVTTGFTAMFLPQISNGKVWLSMNLTSSNLVSIGTVSSGDSSIQSPNVDVSTFQQSVSLTPGDSLLLTSLQQDIGKSDQRGVGAANNYALGGGSGRNSDKQLIAIVITAKVL